MPVPGHHGFAVVAERMGHWQVRFDGVGDLFRNPPMVTRRSPAHPLATHLAVTALGAPLRIGVSSKAANINRVEG